MSIYARGVKNPAYRQRLGYQSMTLMSICCFAAIFILSGDLATRQPIAEALRQDQLALLNQVLAPSLYNNELLGERIEIDGRDANIDPVVYIARQGDQYIGAAFAAVGSGYSGDIKLLMAVDQGGTVLGVRVVSHAETPGLGDKIEIARDPWITAFNGRSLDNTRRQQWAVRKDGGDFDQFTGATITPRAVVNGVYEGLKFYRQQRAAIVAAAAEAANKQNSEQGAGGDATAASKSPAPGEKSPQASERHD